MGAPTRFTFKDYEKESTPFGLAPHQFILHIMPKAELAERKCKTCESVTLKAVTKLLATTLNGEDLRTPKTIYLCIECGDITVTS